MKKQKKQRMRWGAAMLLVTFSLSFASLTLSSFFATSLTKQVGLVKTTKSTKPSGQVPFEGKEKEKEGNSEKSHETVIEFVYAWWLDSKLLDVNNHEYYVSPQSCGNTANLPLYLIKRVLLL